MDILTHARLPSDTNHRPCLVRFKPPGDTFESNNPTNVGVLQRYLAALATPDASVFDDAAGALDLSDVTQARRKRGSLECFNNCVSGGEMKVYQCRGMCLR